jgi:hypothetical protein
VRASADATSADDHGARGLGAERPFAERAADRRSRPRRGPRSSSTKRLAPSASGISATPIASKRALSAGVTMPPSHGPQPMASTTKNDAASVTLGRRDLVEHLVGHRVVALAEVAGARRDRGEEHHPAQRIARGRREQRAQAGYLGVEDPVELLRRSSPRSACRPAPRRRGPAPVMGPSRRAPRRAPSAARPRPARRPPRSAPPSPRRAPRRACRAPPGWRAPSRPAPRPPRATPRDRTSSRRRSARASARRRSETPRHEAGSSSRRERPSSTMRRGSASRAR